MRAKLLMIMLATAFSLFGTIAATRAQDSPTSKPIEPADVFVLVGVVRAELELIRIEMGKPSDAAEQINVTNAAPREVFFQALSLFRKANRLCYEHTRTDLSEPSSPTDAIRPQHVYGVVEAALNQIRKVKGQLGIPERVVMPARDDSRTPTDVFRSILLASRQLNTLLDRQFTPSDVFEQVTLSVSLGARLLARFPDAARIPPTPPYERRKKPTDAFSLLIECFQVVRSIASISDLPIATLARVENDEVVNPGDVYGMATLLVSELVYLHARDADSEPPVQTYYPGRKVPADVYQRTGILLTQLRSLEKLARAHPDWLNSRNRTQ